MSSTEEEQPASLPLDVKFDVVPETLENSYKEHFPVFDKGLVQGEPGGFVFHPHYARNANKIYNMTVRSDDVWIRTFPRSGKFTENVINEINFKIIFVVHKGQLGPPNWPGSSWTIAISKKLLEYHWQSDRPISSKIFYLNLPENLKLIANFLSSTNYFANWGDFAPPEIMDNLITIEKIEQMTSPRVIKSHLPFQLLPPNLLDTAKVCKFFDWFWSEKKN